MKLPNRIIQFLILWILIFCNTAQSSAQVYDLTCDGLHNPLGIESIVPHFSWKNTLTHNGQLQVAYELEVASDSLALIEGKADLWRSGRINSNEQVMIPYLGKSLNEKQLCYWRVRTWDERDNSSGWSTPNRFAIGPINEIKGDYIGLMLANGEAAGTPMIRKTIFLSHANNGAISTSTKKEKNSSSSRSKNTSTNTNPVFAHINSLGYHELYVNGQRVGDEVLQPAVSQLNKHSLIVTYDITPYLHKGENEIMIWLGQGWYRKNIFDIQAKTKQGEPFNGPLVKAEICELSDGQWHTLAHSDSSWEASVSGYSYTGSWLPLQFGGERFDANVKPKWSPVSIFSVDGMKTSPQQFEGNHIIDTHSPDITRLDDGSTLLDFSKVITGWLQVDFGPMSQGQKVMMEYSDYIAQDDTFQSQGESDIYIANGNGKEQFCNKFHHHAFRYVHVRGAKVLDAKALQISALNPKQSSKFSCFDFTRLGAIHDMIHYTMQCLTFSGYMVDCPHLERMGYGGDGNSSTMTLQTMYDVLPTYHNWLTAWGESMGEDGSLAYVAPSFHTGGGPYWSGFIIKAPWRTYLNYGDKRMIERLYEPMKKWLGYVKQYCDTDGLLQPWPDTKERMWFLGDWLAPNGVDVKRESVIHVSNCFLSECLSDMAKMAQLLGKNEDSEQFTAQRKQLNKVIHEHFYHPENHSYANGTPLDQAYALLIGLAPDSVITNAVTQQLLKDSYDKYNGHIAAGLVGIPIFTEWAIKNRQTQLMTDILRQRDYPGYLDMMRKGATTTWESWDGKRSRVHNCYNGIGIWFYQAVAGIRPDEDAPGYRHFFIDPQPIDIGYFQATKNTPFGKINVEIYDTLLYLTIPAGTTATLFPNTPQEQILPAGWWKIEQGKTAVEDTLHNFSTIINGQKVTIPLENRYYNDCNYEIKEAFTENDTLFLLRHFFLWDMTDSIDTCILNYYVITHEQDIYRKNIGKMRFDYSYLPSENENDMYRCDYMDYQNFRESHPVLTRHNMHNMPRLWYSVHIYHGKYYVTVDYPYFEHFTDSMSIYHGMETTFQAISNVQKKGKKTWTYNTLDEIDNTMWTVELKPSKKIRGLYIETRYNPEGKCMEKRLVAPHENLKYFPVIDSDQNCSLWYLDYDEPDYQWLEE